MKKEEKIRQRALDIINEFDRIFTQKYADAVAFKIELTLNKEIDRFYDDYKPKYYDRTFNLYNAVKTFVFKNNGNYAVGLYIGSEYMEPWYQDSKDYVYIGAINLGIHGVSAIHITHPAPLKRMMNSIKKLNFSAERTAAIKYAATKLNLKFKK